MHADFNYGEQCPTALPVPPATGTAYGDFSVHGGHFVYGGSGDPATLSGGFNWTRYGTTANIGVGPVTVSGSGGTVATGALAANVSAAEFVPLPTVPVPSCALTTYSLRAHVAGSNLQID